MHGTILRVLEDGRVVWRADSGAELTGLPESLIRNIVLNQKFPPTDFAR